MATIVSSAAGVDAPMMEEKEEMVPGLLMLV